MAENDLSKRELEILERVATGVTNQQIALDLDISVNTVKAHLRNIYAKLEVESRTEAVMVAIQQGLITVEGESTDGQNAFADDPESSSEQAADTPRAISRLKWWYVLLCVAIVAALVVAALLLTDDSRHITGDPFGDEPGVASGEQPGQEHLRWELRSTMEEGRARFATVALGDLVLVIGGTTEQGVTNSVLGYAYESKTWQELASKPTAVTNISAITLDDRVYVPGGYDTDGRVLDILEIYDAANDAWLTGASLPSPLCAYAITIQNGLIYVLGGWDGVNYLDDVFCYDPEQDTWTVVAQCPSSIGFGAAVSDDSRIYLIGGFDGQQELANCWMFDPAASAETAWEEKSPMEMARRGHAAVVSDGKIYVLGGGWSEYLLYNERYDIATNTWARFESPIIGTWYNLAATLVDEPEGGYVYALGGWDGTYLSTIEAYQASFRIYLPGS